MRHAKKKEINALYVWRKQTNNRNCLLGSLDIRRQRFEISCYKWVQQLKENISKSKGKSHKIKSINKDKEIILKKNQMKVLVLKTTITEMKNSLEAFKSTFEPVKEKIS